MTWNELKQDPVRWKKFCVLAVVVALALAWLLWPADSPHKPAPPVAARSHWIF